MFKKAVPGANHLIYCTDRYMPVWVSRRFYEVTRPIDRPIPEDAAIREAHPARTGRWAVYEDAFRMVAAKHSKEALTDLVNYLLVRLSKAEAKYAGH